MQAHPALVRALPAIDRPVSLVGGVVRDALLGRDVNEDVDLVVEGDAVELASQLGPVLNARVVVHGRFGTATLELPHEPWIDLAMARRERYPQPGALPVVEPGSLADDLGRRDFSINAIAYRLTGRDAGRLVDPMGGRDDLRAGRVRVLHPGSFVDDPSRILRAARYAARLGFRLDPATEAAARAAAPTVDHRSARVGDELRRLLAEPNAARAVEIAAEVGVAWLAPTGDLAERLLRIHEMLGDPDAPSLDAWAMVLGVVVRRELLPALAVDGWARGIAAEVGDAPELLERLGQASAPSTRDLLLSRAKPATVVAAAAEHPAAIREWWRTTRGLRLAISGEDLVRAGVAPGPAIGRGLAAVRAAVLDGAVGDGPEDQLGLALRVAAAGS